MSTNADPTRDVLETSLELVGADEEVARLEKALTRAREAARWARIQHTAATAAMRVELQNQKTLPGKKAS